MVEELEINTATERREEGSQNGGFYKVEKQFREKLRNSRVYKSVDKIIAHAFAVYQTVNYSFKAGNKKAWMTGQFWRQMKYDLKIN